MIFQRGLIKGVMFDYTPDSSALYLNSWLGHSELQFDNNVIPP